MLTTLPSPSAQTIRQSVPDQEDIIRRSLERSARYGVDPTLMALPNPPAFPMSSCASASTGSAFFIRWRKSRSIPCTACCGIRGSVWPSPIQRAMYCMSLGIPISWSISSGGAASPVTVGRSVTSGHAPSGLSLEERVPVFLPGDRMYSAQARKISNAGAPVFRWMGAACSAPFP